MEDTLGKYLEGEAANKLREYHNVYPSKWCQLTRRYSRAGRNLGGFMKEIIIFKESLLQSILSDIFTFAVIVFGVWFNVHYCGNSYFLNGVLLCCWLIAVFSKANSKAKKFYSPKDAIAYLEKNTVKPEEL